MRKLMPHQKMALEYALNEQVNPAWLLQMRTGKTLTTIRWVQKLDLQTKIVVAPLTVLSSWEKELRLEGEPFVRWTDYDNPEKNAAITFAFRKKRWLLVNYEGVFWSAPIISTTRGRTRGIPIIAQLPWDAVILDESPKIKNPAAGITDICVRGFRMAKHRAILTGLVAPETLLDAFTQFQFLDGHFMGFKSFWEFRYQNFRKIVYDWVPKPGVKRAIKEYVHKRAFVMSAKDAGMTMKKVYEERLITDTSSAALITMYKKVERDFAVVLTSADGGQHLWETNYATERLIWLRKIAGGFAPDNMLLSTAKFKEIVGLLKGELREQSAIIWFAFRHEISFCANYLAKPGPKGLGCEIGVITGDTPPRERARIIEQFAAGKLRVVCAMEECAKYGIDCSRAGVAFYYSNSYSANSRVQSEDRVLHPNKFEPSLIVDLITKNTVDEDIVQVMKDKSFEGRLIMRKFARAFNNRINREKLANRKLHY